MGLVFVLLIGEIDLSAGYAGGVTAGVVGILMTDHAWPWVPALLAGILSGTVDRPSIGLLVAKLGSRRSWSPWRTSSALQGVLLLETGAGGTIAYRNNAILAIMNKNLPVWLGWTLAVLTVVAYAALGFSRRLTRARAGLPTPTILSGR